MTWIFDAKVTPLFCLKRIINDIGIPVFPHVCWYNHVKSNFVLNPHPRATLQPPRRGHPLPSRADDEKQRQRHRNIIASPSIWRQPRQPLPHQVPQQQGQLHSTVEAIGVRRKSRFKWKQHGINKFVEGKIYENLQETMELPMNNIYMEVFCTSSLKPIYWKFFFCKRSLKTLGEWTCLMLASFPQPFPWWMAASTWVRPH